VFSAAGYRSMHDKPLMFSHSPVLCLFLLFGKLAHSARLKTSTRHQQAARTKTWGVPALLVIKGGSNYFIFNSIFSTNIPHIF
jgi:hypothetical protein